MSLNLVRVLETCGVDHHLGEQLEARRTTSFILQNIKPPLLWSATPPVPPCRPCRPSPFSFVFSSVRCHRCCADCAACLSGEKKKLAFCQGEGHFAKWARASERASELGNATSEEEEENEREGPDELIVLKMAEELDYRKEGRAFVLVRRVFGRLFGFGARNKKRRIFSLFAPSLALNFPHFLWVFGLRYRHRIKLGSREEGGSDALLVGGEKERFSRHPG